MSDLQSPSSSGGSNQSQVTSALFMNFVLSQTNLALMMLGKVPHPHTGEVFHDLESAKLFIDQLEMIEAKTKGNLDPDEAKFLHQSLTSLRLAFVDAVEKPMPPPAPSAPPAAPVVSESSKEESETKKRFSKKY